jgi:hypothetical protein
VAPAAAPSAAASLAKIEELETPVTNIAKATATRTERFVIVVSVFEAMRRAVLASQMHGYGMRMPWTRKFPYPIKLKDGRPGSNSSRMVG